MTSKSDTWIGISRQDQKISTLRSKNFHLKFVTNQSDKIGRLTTNWASDDCCSPEQEGHGSEKKGNKKEKLNSLFEGRAIVSYHLSPISVV